MLPKSALKIFLTAVLLLKCRSWSPRVPAAQRGSKMSRRRRLELKLNNKHHEVDQKSSRRHWLQTATLTLTSMVVTGTQFPQISSAAAPALAAEVTDKVFLEIKGLPVADGAASTTARIVIGLFGKEAPSSVGKLKGLVSRAGLITGCKPKEERMLQREQLEANKVYNSCVEGQDKGVNYDYAQIWRVLQGERLDFGSVAGKFVAREFPTWEEAQENTLKHDRVGIVSVRRGSDSGFGFTVYPGGAGDIADLDENHIVLGQVLEGLDTIEAINNIPVVTSSKINYMGLTGGPNTKTAPSRACRYGGAMYCNENKPLLKLTIYKSGVL